MYDQAEPSAARATETVEHDERPRRHVESQAMEMAESVAALEHSVQELEKRLGSVLRPEEEGTQKAMTEPHAPLVPLAEQLQAYNDKIRWIRWRVTSVLDRLEL